MSKSEAAIQAEILFELNKSGHRLWRSNAGRIQTKQNRWIKLFPKGFPDTVGYRKGDGKFIAIEIKNSRGKLRDAQERFKEFAKDQPILYGVARSVEEAIAIVEG